MSLSAMVLSAALAARAEPWGDPLVPTIPADRAFASVDALQLVRDGLWLSDLEIGAGVAVGSLDVGVVLHGGAQRAETAQGIFLAPAPIGADLWLSVENGAALHGVALGLHNAIWESPFYRTHPAETGLRALLRYAGCVRTARDIQLSTEIRGGLSTVLPVEISVAGAATKIVRPALAVSGSLAFGNTPSGTLLAGAHIRPLPRARSAEIGLSAGLSLPLQQRQSPAGLVWVELKLFQAQRGTAAATLPSELAFLPTVR